MLRTPVLRKGRKVKHHYKAFRTVLLMMVEFNLARQVLGVKHELLTTTMKAIVNFKFDDFKTETEKEVIVDTTKVIETVNSEINKFLEETNSDIYGDEDLSHTTYYQGSVDIEVQIKFNDEYFSVAEFEDFTNNGFSFKK